MVPSPKIVRVGYVPEHFSTPLHFAQNNGYFASHGLTVELNPYPSGTGAMIKDLKENKLDLAVGLTEGWIARIATQTPENPCLFKLVGKYVDSRLCWAISTGIDRSDINSPQDLEGGKKLGISRIGSGSYVMAYVLAEQNNWALDKVRGKDGSVSPFEWVILNDFANLRKGVNHTHPEGLKADAFMWEHFTSKKYYDSKEIKRIGEIYTPWPSWHIVAHTSLDSDEGKTIVRDFLASVNLGINHFNTHKDEAVAYISTALDYSKEDATNWLETVEFVKDCSVVDRKVVENTLTVLKKAGVVEKEDIPWDVLVMGLEKN